VPTTADPDPPYPFKTLPWLARALCKCGEPADYGWEGAICIVCHEAGRPTVPLFETPVNAEPSDRL
jgi:hypothetical protein